VGRRETPRQGKSPGFEKPLGALPPLLFFPGRASLSFLGGRPSCPPLGVGHGQSLGPFPAPARTTGGVLSRRSKPLPWANEVTTPFACTTPPRERTEPIQGPDRASLCPGFRTGGQGAGGSGQRDNSRSASTTGEQGRDPATGHSAKKRPTTSAAKHVLCVGGSAGGRAEGTAPESSRRTGKWQPLPMGGDGQCGESPLFS